MSVYAMLRDAAAKGSLTVEDVEMKGALDGNLCRCTGYKPILDAVKSFVGEYNNKGKSVEEVKINFEAGNLDPEDFKSCCDKHVVTSDEISTDSEQFLLLTLIDLLFANTFSLIETKQSHLQRLLEIQLQFHQS